MPAMSRGNMSTGARAVQPTSKVVKARKTTGKTPSSRRHHFESFSHRIAKLRIDPIRRTRRAIGAEGSHDLDNESSYLRTALDEWKDLNLSENFTAFAKLINPWTDSLAMVLHYEDRIMDSLMTYISKEDAYSLEPLLALLSHFAHDLDVRFERHFERAVETVTRVASKHAEVEVIEWSFTCLAWLFKYLSRLLVPDLRPLYTLMAPYMGKERQKPFIIRFAAEAMSFLVRKAGTAYSKNKEPLDTIVKYMITDYASSAEAAPNDLYAQGLMTLFTESIKGIQGTLHSGGNAVLECLTVFCFDITQPESLRHSSLEILKGSLISVVHHTNAETFKPVLEGILEMTDSARENRGVENVEAASTLLFTAAATRKSSRISEWPVFIQRVADLIRLSDASPTDLEPATMMHLLKTFAVVITYAPMDALLPELAVLDTITRGKWKPHFLPFCNLLTELDAERFRSLVLSHFQQFIVKNWKEDEGALCALLPALSEKGISSRASFQCPTSWQKSMLTRLEGISRDVTAVDESGRLLPLMNGELSVLRSTQGDMESRKAISQRLVRLLEIAVKQEEFRLNDESLFAFGQGFRYIAEVSAELLPESLLELICSTSAHVRGLLPYWSALDLALGKATYPESKVPWTDAFLNDVIGCLSAPNHELRLAGLRILNTIYSHNGQTVPEVITIALSIEDTPPSVQTARFISSQIRRMAAGYEGILKDPVLAKAVPSYCFGLLHIKLSQAWDDAIQALQTMSEHETAEDVVSTIISSWLRGTEDESTASVIPLLKSPEPLRHVSSDFECSNLLQIENTFENTLILFDDAQAALQRRFAIDHTCASLAAASNRSQALRALNGMPQLAEKKSRILVPVLLEWVGDADSADDALDGEKGDTRWGRKDQKAMLAIFGQFVNPKVLFKSTEVQQALLTLLTNGDNDIQRSALKALLAWKTPSLVRYQEHLENFLDDTRFREEISVFLRLDEDGDAIRSDDCPDLMPVLLRLLFGKAVTRAGSASGKRGQQTRRKAIFVALAKFPDDIIGQFLDIALGSLSQSRLTTSDGSLNKQAVDELSVSQRKQAGLLNMLEDMLQTLGDQLSPFARKMADAILLCIIRASKAADTSLDAEESPVAEETQTSLARTIRQAGFHCLNRLFATCADASWRDYARIIMQELIVPRIDKLPVETAQAVSGPLRLFSTWAADIATCVFLTEFYTDTIKVVANCLVVPSAKNAVRTFIVENILGQLLDTIQPRSRKGTNMEVDITESQSLARQQILEPNASYFVVKLGELLRQSPPKDLLDTSVSCVSRLAPLVSGASEVRDVIDVSIYLLAQPPRVVHHTTKRDLLQTLYHLVPAADLDGDTERFDQIYSTLCPLFAFFKDRESRVLLSTVVNQLSEGNAALEEAAVMCDDLNSFSTMKLDEPDFARRANAFNALNDSKYKVFSAKQWQPLLYNMLYYIKDDEEVAIRTNASYSLRRFVEAASSEGSSKNEDFQQLISSGLWPGMQAGMKEPSELVRSEYLLVTAQLVKHLSSWDVVNDMHPLLVGDDDEASFFTNILHIQQHRRLRALRRLADEAKAGVISSTNVSNFFIPLLEHFIFDPASDESAHNLAAETIHSVGALSGCLEWPFYQGTLRRFIAYVKSKPDIQKTVLRLVGSVVDSLDRAAQSVRKANAPSDGETSMAVDGEASTVVDGEMYEGRLAKTLPTEEKLTSQVTKNFLPPLTDFLHLKDESTVSLRVPVAVAVIKLIRVLPEQEHGIRLPSVLMDICHILRSKAPESRDMARKSLADIMKILGATYFGYIIKELRSALQRGYQLHVLSFTVHSILVENISMLHAGDLDFCLSDIVAVIMDDIFGAVGQEKDAEEYISKMKEVKSSKSYDSMELVAKITTLPHLGGLIRPVQTLLMEKLDMKTVKKIDELLRRVGLGTTHNEAVKDRDVLIFCYEIIQQFYAASAAASEKRRPAMDDYKTRKYLIQMQSANKSGKRGSTTSYSFKLVRFALDLVRSVLQRHEDLKTPANVAGFLPIIGDALVGGQEEVQLAAVRLLSSIVKVPSPKIADNAPVYVSEAIKIIRAAPSTTTEVAQAALKLVAAVLRERPAVKVKENDLAYVLKRVKPDLEEPDRQGVIFTFLKAVLSRKVVITEVYETIDTVAAIMVTNQTRTARDLARGVYFQFMMDYPQAGGRLSKQIAFLVKNLDYQYLEGRQSILEFLHLLLSKTNGDLVQELSSMLFVPLVMVMVNDESPECREMAGALIGMILERADDDRTKNFVSLMRTWLDQDEQVLLRRIALQCWTMYIGSGKAPAKESTYLFKRVSQLLNPEAQKDQEWELLYYSLQAFAKLSESAPATALAAGTKTSWTNIFRCLTYPHAWVKLSAARLIGLLFADIGSASSKTEQGLAALPLRSSGGLQLTQEELQQLCYSSLRMLNFTQITEQLVAQTVRNLIFLGRCYGVNNATWKFPVGKTEDEATEHEDEEEEVSDEEDEDDEENEDEKEASSSSSPPRPALSYLLSRLSAVIRRDTGTLTSPILVAKTGALQAVAAISNILPAETLTPSLESMLSPLYVLTDSSIPGPRIFESTLSEQYKSLSQLALETMALLQKKVGTGVYVNVMGKVQERVRGRREERRVKRRIEAVSAPERWAAEKRRKMVGKREKRKEVGHEARGRRRGW